MSRDRIDELLQRLLDDEITASQMDELTEVIASDEEVLTQLRHHLLMSDRLSQYEDQLRSDGRFLSALQVRIGADGDSERFVDQVVASIHDEASNGLHQASVQNSKRTRRNPLSVAGWVTAAIAILFLAAVLIGQNNPFTESVVESAGSGTPDEINDLGVAVLTRVSNLAGERTADWGVGETIPPGLLEWDAGLLQLEFYGGATVVAEGPASVDILDDSRVICRSGRLRVHVPEPARGFAVLAPTVELVDLGTEFGIDVVAGGATEVHVFDGKVELYDAKSNRNVATRRELNAGDAVTVDRYGQSRKIEARDVDFVTPKRLSSITDTQRQGQLRDWRAFRDSLQDDPRVVAYFPFDRSAAADRLLIGYGADGSTIEGAIVGCEWSEGRWPDKTSLQFKRPGDRVRITVPGEFESLTYSTWLRVDGLDREFNSLLLTDDYIANGLHWQIHQDGALVLGVKRTVKGSYGYQTDSIFNLFRLGQWVHLATVYDNDKAHVTHYVNGQLATREPMRETASGGLRIGAATIGNWSFSADAIPRNDAQRARRVRNLNGCMDELIVFGEALDDQEVRRIYEVGRP